MLFKNSAKAVVLQCPKSMDTMPKKLVIPAKFQPWIEARRKFNLSHAHIQMARELGFNPKKLGKLNNHDQQPWKLPLPDFIAKLYLKNFGKQRPDIVHSIEEMVAAKQAKKRAQKARKLAQSQQPAAHIERCSDSADVPAMHSPE